MSRLLIVAALVICVSACEGDIEGQLFDVPKNKSSGSGTPNVSVAHDNERQVTCWIYRWPGQGSASISCLPDRFVVQH